MRRAFRSALLVAALSFVGCGLSTEGSDVGGELPGDAASLDHSSDAPAADASVESDAPVDGADADVSVEPSDGADAPDEDATGDGGDSALDAEAGADSDANDDGDDADGASCEGGEKDCNGVCVASGDPLTGCGGSSCAPCVFAHASAVCFNGACALGTCDAGFSDCDGDATNGCEAELVADPQNCGSCGAACALPNATATCVASQCALGPCAQGFADCDTNPANGCEVNLTADPQHCGGCANACSAQGGVPECKNGVCGLSSCQAGLGNCDGDETNGCETSLGSDVKNCGFCGNACSYANGFATCANATCALSGCANSYANCDGNDANGCETNVLTSVQSCGGCGKVCALPNATPVCTSGSCHIAKCATGFADCDGSDANGCETVTAGDVANCGACNAACQAGPHSTAACNAGTCTLSCQGGFADCNVNPSDGCESDVKASTSACGGCGNVCPTRPNSAPVCSAGVCGMQCNSGFGDCNAFVFDGCEQPLTNDVNHCGSCGKVCPAPTNADATCTGTTCGYTCKPGFGDCNGSALDGCETDLTSSAIHCGSCAKACAFDHATSACSGGACVLGACSVGWLDCDGAPGDGCEVNGQNDPNHCGSCATSCAVDAGSPFCAGGVCGVSCSGGYADCDGIAANGCETELSSDPAHCGNCGTNCVAQPNAAASCAGGTCGIACNAGFADCDGSPTDGCEVNVASNVQSCGTCGNVCPTAQHAAPACAAGKCGLVCDAGFGDCDGDASNGCETPLATTVANCGACGNACPGGANGSASCVNGACGLACASGFADCDGQAFDGCETNIQTSPLACGSCTKACPAGANASTTCVGGVCGLACATGFADCDGQAADGCETSTQTSVGNCGACGNACPGAANATATCSAGACGFACKAGYADCDALGGDGCEVSTQTSVANCGSCGKACPVPAGASATCSAGSCGFVCDTGRADCDGSAADGCEIDTQTSVTHCGSCANACAAPAGATATCAAGSCGFACDANRADCNGLAADGCEVDTLTSVAHCGGCATACAAPAHASATCTGGTCGFTCDAGFADCNGVASDGCEIDLANDPSHCGGCGTTCSFANGTAACNGGQCVLASCAAGHANCDGVTSNGCEIDTLGDPSNCGGCGFGCEAVNVVTQACVAGKCAPSCATDWADCDGPAPGNVDDGCEIQVTADPNNCGGCGYACDSQNVASKVCTAGKCAPNCTADHVDCNGPAPGDADDGCEVDTASDPTNCGGCGLSCSAAGVAASLCTAGTCTPVCVSGFGDCDAPKPGGADDGCEVNLQTDTANCGSCGGACSTNHTTTLACSAGQCAPACAAGFGDCNGPAPGASDDGCEDSTTTDVANCGACGRACSTTHVLGASCAAGVCTSSCQLGYENCSQPASGADNGCETASTDASCGGCGNSCAAQGSGLVCGAETANQCGCTKDSQCRTGSSGGNCNNNHQCTCGLATCKPGEACIRNALFLDVCACNGGAACGNGQTCCQTPAGCKDLTSDAQNCGACGRACPGSMACSGSACVCASAADCNAGSAGTCASGKCVCSGTTCAAGQRCLPNGTCG